MLLAIAVAYVLVQGSSQLYTGGNVSLDVALAKRDLYGSDFMWFRKDGRQYLIRDAATLERFQQLVERARVYKPEAKRIKSELRSLERRESQLDREIDRLGDRDDGDPPLTADDKARLADLHRELDGVHSQIGPLERQAEQIDRKRQELEAEPERQMVPMFDEAIRKSIATEVR